MMVVSFKTKFRYLKYWFVVFFFFMKNLWRLCEITGYLSFFISDLWSLWRSSSPEIKRPVAPPAATIIEILHLFIGNSDRLKQFVIDGFWWEVKEQMSFMVLLTRLKKLILVCRWCQSWPSILYLILSKYHNTAGIKQLGGVSRDFNDATCCRILWSCKY